MLSGGAGRGGEEPDRRVGHVQGSGHKAQLQRHGEALRQDGHTVGGLTGGPRRPAPRRARRQGGLFDRAHRGGGRQGAAAGGSPRRASTSGFCTGIPARTRPATTPSPSSCAGTASPSGPPAARSRTRASRRRPGCSRGSTGRSRSGTADRDGELFSSTCSRRRWAIPAGTYSSGRDQDDRRPGQVHVRHDREARRRAPRVGHGQHVRPGGGQGRQAPQGPARIRVRQGRRLRAEAVPPARPPGQGQGRVVEPLPVAARGLPGRLRRLGRHRRDDRADRGRRQLRAQRDHGAAALRAVHGGEGRAAARRQPPRP